MPGLPAVSAVKRIDLVDGRVVGLIPAGAFPSSRHERDDEARVVGRPHAGERAVQDGVADDVGVRETDSPRGQGEVEALGELREEVQEIRRLAPCCLLYTSDA